MSNKELEEALDNLDHLEEHMNKHGEFGNNGDWEVCRKYATLYHKLLPHLETIVEARKLATEGEWLYRPNNFDDWGAIKVKHGEDCHVFAANSRSGEYNCNSDEHRKNNTDPYEPNGKFITTAANETNAIKRIMEEM